MSKFFLPIAFLASAISFPFMLFERAIPIWPTREQLDKDMPPLTWRTAFHHAKNLMTECVRKDSQYFSKALSFVILILAVLLGVL